MEIGEALDRLIEPFAPTRARRRYAERMALKAMRQYDAAANGRRTQGWRRTSSSADREIRQGLVGLRNGARELCRNNKNAASAKRQIIANLIGDGIGARAVHSDPKVAAAAQAAWDKWAHGKVDGRHDFYGVQKLAASAMVEGGESLIVWGPDATGPDGRCRVLEGDYLDHLKQNLTLGAGRIVQGVEFDGQGDRAAYWLYPAHPGDFGGYFGQSQRFDARDVDHVFEELRPGQTRGISWFAPVAMTLRDVADFEEAVLMKKKVEACLALILTPPDAGTPSPLATPEQPDPAKPAIETLRPGMIFRSRPGETAHSLNPTSTGDGVDFIHHQITGVSANLAPAHLVTGDVSKSNYSSLRAALLGFWAMLDDWQQNIIVPFLCGPAFDRRMRRLAMETGDKRFFEVTASWAMPARRSADPIKDLAGEIMEIRGGLKSEPQALAERGRNWQTHYAEIAESNKLIDSLGLAFDTDPRRVAATGVLQPPAGFLIPKGDSQDDTPDPNANADRAMDFLLRMGTAARDGDTAALNSGFAEAALALRAGDPQGVMMATVLTSLMAETD